MWDTDALQCSIVKQKTVLQQILATGGETSIISIPDGDCYKITNSYYDGATDEQVIITE